MKEIKIMSLMLSSVIAFTSIIPVFVTYTKGYAVDSTVNVTQHTSGEIKEYIDFHSFSTAGSDSYSSVSSEQYPYSAGSIYEELLQNALNAINCMRYVAGLPEVLLSSEYNKLAQYASLVNSVNDVLNHFPEQPSDMPDDIYQFGKEGAGFSNICISSRNIALSVMLYMNDSNSSNISQVGHRRWCLNPEMQKTGFGIVGEYSAMYVNDMKRADATEKGMCWSAQNMPI